MSKINNLKYANLSLSWICVFFFNMIQFCYNLLFVPRINSRKKGGEYDSRKLQINKKRYE